MLQVLVLTMSLLLAQEGQKQKYNLDVPLAGVQSRYSPLLLNLLKSWPPKDIDYTIKSTNPVQLKCIETPGNLDYIGIEQVMRVNKPLNEVASVLDDMEHYKDLFEGYADIQVLAKDGNKIETYWEAHIPIPFVKNSVYKMMYVIDKNQKRTIYRYQLKEKTKSIKFSDGIIVLEPESPTTTRYTEYDFWDADWGILKSIAPSRVWGDSVEGIYLSDVAVKLKVENPTWSYDKIKEECHKILKSFPLDDVLKKRKRFILETK